MKNQKKRNARNDRSLGNGSNGNGGNKVHLALLYTVALIVMAFALISISSYFLPQVGFINSLRNGETALPPRPPMDNFADSGGMGSYFDLRLVLSAVNLLLVIYLLYVYTKDYLRYKTSFALGILAFLFSFLLYALSSFPLVHAMFGFRAIGGVFSFIPLLFSAIGLVIFVKLSNE